MTDYLSWKALKKLIQETRFPGIELSMKQYAREVRELKLEVSMLREENKLLREDVERWSVVVENGVSEMRASILNVRSDWRHEFESFKRDFARID